MVAIESGLVFEIFSRWWWIVRSSSGLIEHQIIENQVKVRQTDNLKCQKTQYFINKNKKKRVIGLVQSPLTSSSMPLPYTMNVSHVVLFLAGLHDLRRPIFRWPVRNYSHTFQGKYDLVSHFNRIDSWNYLSAWSVKVQKRKNYDETVKNEWFGFNCCTDVLNVLKVKTLIWKQMTFLSIQVPKQR